MTCSPKLKKLLKKYGLPDDATHEEVLRALDVQCADQEIDRSEVYSKKCRVCVDQEDTGAGYD